MGKERPKRAAAIKAATLSTKVTSTASPDSKKTASPAKKTTSPIKKAASPPKKPPSPMKKTVSPATARRTSLRSPAKPTTSTALSPKTRQSPRKRSSPKRPSPSKESSPPKRKSPSKEQNLSPDDDVFEVDCIKDKRETADGQIEYYVKWKDYPNTANTWEPVENIQAEKLVDAFERKLADKKAPSPRESDSDSQDVDVTEQDSALSSSRKVRLLRSKGKPSKGAAKGSPPRSILKGSPTRRKSPASTSSGSGDSPRRIPSSTNLQARSRAAKVSPAKQGTSARRIQPKRAVVVSISSDTEESTDIASISPDNKNLVCFSEFKSLKVINDSPTQKSITFEAVYNKERAIVRLERTLLDEALAKKALAHSKTTSELSFNNDIYSSYILVPPESIDTIHNIQATLVYPADDTALAKYSRSKSVFFCETPEIYNRIVDPYVESFLNDNEDHTQWIYNIQEGKSEKERVAFNDPDPNSGFILINDFKWSGNESDLHMIAICNQRDIRSLRDLNDQHLTLLRNILAKGTKAIQDKYKKAEGQLRVFVHYPPTFYHFHVHFRIVDPSDYQGSDRDNLLHTVISNISLNKDHYKNACLTYPLSVDSELYGELKKAKKV